VSERVHLPVPNARQLDGLLPSCLSPGVAHGLQGLCGAGEEGTVHVRGHRHQDSEAVRDGQITTCSAWAPRSNVFEHGVEERDAPLGMTGLRRPPAAVVPAAVDLDGPRPRVDITSTERHEFARPNSRAGLKLDHQSELGVEAGRSPDDRPDLGGRERVDLRLGLRHPERRRSSHRVGRKQPHVDGVV
jgi:hypothetical protein